MKKKIDISELIKVPKNQFHPLVFINGKPKIGKNVYIGFFSEVNAKGAEVEIGNNCDIASFVSINVADSHKKVIGLSKDIERNNIILENNVFVGSHSFIGRGVYIGHHSVVGAGTIIAKPCKIPPYSLVVGNPPIIKEGCYKQFLKEKK
jgi:acetyltransferase-like isoleucine patch superfamily enzyme